MTTGHTVHTVHTATIAHSRGRCLHTTGAAVVGGPGR